MIERVTTIKAKRWQWRCRCDCGTIKVISSTRLVCNLTKSCGCLHREHTEHIKLRHGHCRIGKLTSVYMRWHQMVRRCTEPGHERYADYGGRGITVCARWMTFENFLADMGEPPRGMVLDRQNNDGNYEPGNCHWATRVESARNCRSNRVVIFNGRQMSLAEAAEVSGLPYSTLNSRVQRRVPADQLFIPKQR